MPTQYFIEHCLGIMSTQHVSQLTTCMGQGGHMHQVYLAPSFLMADAAAGGHVSVAGAFMRKESASSAANSLEPTGAMGQLAKGNRQAHSCTSVLTLLPSEMELPAGQCYQYPAAASSALNEDMNVVLR